MSKKKNKFVESTKESAQADLTDLIDAAKTSLFELDQSYSFIDDQIENPDSLHQDEELIKASDIYKSLFDDGNVKVELESKIKDDVNFDVDLDIKSEVEHEVVKATIRDNDDQDGKLFYESESESESGFETGFETEPEIVSELSAELETDIKPNELLEEHLFGELINTESLDQKAFSSTGNETTDELVVSAPSLEGTELDSFESAQIEELEFISEEHLQSVIESILFATDRPVSMATIKQVFVGTNVSTARIKTAIESLKTQYAAVKSGVSLDDIGSGYQLRTKLDNMEFLRRSLKARPFKLSGPALEVLAIVAYKQPMIKSEIDEIRGVESGHLLRALMEKNLCTFAGKSELPGKPMQYETTRKFLEIFSLRNLKELPTLSQIDELLPEGIGDEADEKPRLHDITDGLSQQIGSTYSESEEELNKITGQLEEIQTTTDFFEQEKQRQKEQREAEKAQNIRDAMSVGEKVSSRDVSWLKRYEEQKLEPQVSEEDVIKPETAQASGHDEFDELSMVLDEVGEEDSFIDMEVIEANDLADID